jgi:hypothetical protein
MSAAQHSATTPFGPSAPELTPKNLRIYQVSTSTPARPPDKR